MGDMAIISFTGRLTRAAQATPTEANPNTSMVRFSVACSYYDWKSKERVPTFYEVKMFMNQKRLASSMQFLQKASPVFVTGKLQPRTVQDDRGTKVWMNVEDADFEPMGPPQAAQGAGQDAPQAGPPAAAGPPVAPALPTGWTKQNDPASGHDYYVGPGGVTQWNPPAAPATAPPVGPPPATAPPGSYGESTYVGSPPPGTSPV